MLFRNAVLLPAAVLAANETSNMQVTKGLDYVGDGDNHHKMDLYMPSTSSENTPVVVWIAGTAFAGLGYDRIGMAERYPCPQLTEQGIGCAAIAYSSSPWPAQHQDTRAAVRFLRANGKQGKYGLGAGKIGVHGASSGGNQAGHIWSSGHLEDEVFGSEFKRIGQFPQESAAVSAAAIYWPEYHLDPDDEPACEYSEARKNPHGPQSEANYASNVDNVKKMSAETYLDSSTPPAYMVHGTSDQQVSPCNTVEAYTLAKSKGIDVDVTYVQGGDHGCAQFGPVWSNGCTNCHGVDPDVLAKMLAFFEKNLKGEDPPSPPTPPAPPSPPAPTPKPTPSPVPTPTPTPGPSPVSAECEQCLGQACPQLKDTGAAECYSCLEQNKRSCASSCYSSSYTFDQLKSLYCDAKEVQV